MFDKRTTTVVQESDKTVSKVILPTVYSCLLSGSEADSTGQQRTIPMYFRAPRRSASRSECFFPCCYSIFVLCSQIDHQVDLFTYAPIFLSFK